MKVKIEDGSLDNLSFTLIAHYLLLIAHASVAVGLS